MEPARPDPLPQPFHWLALGSILLVAAILRFYNLSQQGFMVFDDGAYVVAAKRSASEFARIAELVQAPPELIAKYESFFRPGFITLVKLNSHLVGWRSEERRVGKECRL